MANTITQTTLLGSGTDTLVARHIHIVSDGSEETDLVIYDNSTLINDTSKGRLLKVEAHGADCVLRFEWDQTTDSPICSLNPADGQSEIDLTYWGGGSNPNGTGATGDIVLTTANLDSGDEVSIFMLVEQT